MIGAPDMAFPRLNALSYWLLPIAGTMMLTSFFFPGFGAGWTNYAPLSVDQPFGNVFFSMAVQWAGASSIMTALNFLVTIITMRAPGMTFWRMPLLVWANFTTSLLVVIATPFIAGSQFFVMFDRVMHTYFFDVVNGGYPLGYQHIFWFYSHPAVYIMMLPGFGIASEVISAMSRKPIFGYRLMALSLVAILILGFSVWAHHMFVAGMAPWLRIPMMITTLLIAVPTGIKVFSWLATTWEGRINFATPMLWALGFVSMFVIGGLSGIFLGAVPIDIATRTRTSSSRTSTTCCSEARCSRSSPVLLLVPEDDWSDVQRDTRKVRFMTFVAFNATFFPMHIIGVQGWPRRVYTYEDQFGNWNFFISIAGFVLGASFIVFLYNMVVSWARGRGRRQTRGGPTRSSGRFLAAAHLQLRRDSAGGREPARVRRARREARDPERRSRDGDRDGDRGGAAVRHLLVVANETVTGGGLIDAVKRKAKEQDVELVTVLAPVSTPEAGYVVYEDTRRAAAGRRLDRTLSQLREAGILAHGLVLETDPEAAVKDAFGMLDPPPTEIIVSTHPIQKSGWLRKNVVDRIKKAAATSSSSTSSSTTRTKRDAQRARRRQRDRRRQGARSIRERAERAR